MGKNSPATHLQYFSICVVCDSGGLPRPGPGQGPFERAHFPGPPWQVMDKSHSRSFAASRFSFVMPSQVLPGCINIENVLVALVPVWAK